METGLKIKLISFKQLGLRVFFLLLSLQFQLHLLLPLPQNSMVAAADLNHENNIGREPKVAKKLSISVKLGGKHEIKAVERVGRGGAVGARDGGGGGGGEHGSAGDAAGDNGGGTTKSANRRGGALIPVYTAGAMNHNRDRHHHGSSSGTTINGIGSSCMVLILFTSFFFVYSI